MSVFTTPEKVAEEKAQREDDTIYASESIRILSEQLTFYFGVREAQRADVFRQYELAEAAGDRKLIRSDGPSHGDCPQAAWNAVLALWKTPRPT